MVVDISQCKLLEMSLTNGPPCSLSHLLNGRQQHRDQDGNDRDDHKEFDECECISMFGFQRVMLNMTVQSSIATTLG